MSCASLTTPRRTGISSAATASPTPRTAAHLRDVPLTAVAGNCDYGSTARTEWLLELEGVRILLTHGHGYAVKQGTGALLRRARELEAQVVLFGHTHQRLLEEADGVLLINPGSCRDERYYAELEVEAGQILTARLWPRQPADHPPAEAHLVAALPLTP